MKELNGLPTPGFHRPPPGRVVGAPGGRTTAAGSSGARPLAKPLTSYQDLLLGWSFWDLWSSQLAARCSRPRDRAFSPDAQKNALRRELSSNT
jgi:hypothetical protein